MLTSPFSHGVIAALLVASLGMPAFAEAPDGGVYLRVFGGVSSLEDSDLSGAISGETGFDTGQVFGAAVGYDYAGSPFRSELEYAYRTGDADGAAGISGDLASTTLALNGYYDFAPIADGRLVPYIGAGLAYVTEIDFDVSGGSAPGEYNDTGVFGYQLMVGADYAISDRWSINGELRYFDAGDQSLSGPGGSLSADYQTIDVLVGASYRF